MTLTSQPKGDGRLPSSAEFDHLVYLRIFEGCNLHCQHCFIPSNPKRMTLDDIEAAPSLLRNRLPAGSRILVQWHGGEPTLMGPAFIRQAIAALRANGPEFTWQFGIQTNLMTFDHSWVDLYREEFGSEVGVSWDPKIRLLNSHALDSNPEFNRRFDDRLSSLVNSGLTPYLVVTATRALFKAFPNPFDFFDHWVSRGVRHVHLERVTPTGFARRNWDLVGLSNAEYSAQMGRWMKAYQVFKASKAGSTPLFLSPFENILESVRSLLEGQPQSQGCWSGHCDTRFHTIDADGYKFGCTALTGEQGNRNANIQLDLGVNLREKRDLRTYDCRKCAFKPICSSGCLALSFDDGSGECSGGHALFSTAAKLAGSKDTYTAPEITGGSAPRLS